ncbi:hypothetical protein GCM10023204_17790 [Actinomycetospora succinea]
MGAADAVARGLAGHPGAFPEGPQLLAEHDAQDRGAAAGDVTDVSDGTDLAGSFLRRLVARRCTCGFPGWDHAGTSTSIARRRACGRARTGSRP